MNLLAAADVGLTINAFLSTLLYSAVGMAVFFAAFMLMNRFLPFSLRKEIEEDQNIALGVIIGAVFIALAIIISAAISG